MLADDIAAAVDGPWDRQWAGAVTGTAKLIATAQRFSVTQEVILSAAALAQRPWAEQLRALSACRLPAPRCFFEWNSGDGGRCGALIELGEHDQQLTELPRTGNIDPRCGKAIAVERHPNGLVVVNPLMTDFDWRELPARTPLSPTAWAKVVAELEADRVRYGWDDAEFAAAKAFSARHTFAPFMGTGELLDEQPGQDRRFAEHARRRIDLIRILVLLLNSRNVTRVTLQTIPEKLQRARRRAGKAPLGDYRQIDIHLSHILAARAGGVADARQPMRLHVVRGHFKIRKTGVFWWSSFPRGSGAGGEVRRVRRIAA